VPLAQVVVETEYDRANHQVIPDQPADELRPSRIFKNQRPEQKFADSQRGTDDHAETHNDVEKLQTDLERRIEIGDPKGLENEQETTQEQADGQDENPLVTRDSKIMRQEIGMSILHKQACNKEVRI
jgi:hypothetical protein